MATEQETEILELPRYGRGAAAAGFERVPVEFSDALAMTGVPAAADRDLLLAALLALAGRYSGQSRFAVLVQDEQAAAFTADLSGAPGAAMLVERLRVPHGVPVDAGAARLGLVLAEAPAPGLDLLLHLPGGRVGDAALVAPAGRFEAGMLSRMARHLAVILAGMRAEPDRPVERLPFMDEAERQSLLVERNRTHADFDRGERIEAVFARQVEARPAALALIAGGRAISYAELDRRANSLARRLARGGAGPGRPVGVHCPRSADAIMALLAIMKAGAPYVPLDTANPPARTAALIEAAGCLQVVATQREAADLPPGLSLVRLDDPDGEETDEGLPAEAGLSAEDAACIIFTSGSTGVPKGVEGSHRAALNRFHWMWRSFPFQPGEVCCQKTSLAFVDSIWEIFGPLLAGVPSVVVPAEDLLDPDLFIDTLARHAVTRIVLVPSLLRVLLDVAPDLGARLPRLKLWSVSGEPLPAETVRRFAEAAPGAAMLNIYGSSEVTADVTAQIVDASVTGHTAPIGDPIANAQIYLLDRNREPVPLGVPGEICVGGEPVAKGYWRRPDLTEERFVPDPFGLDGSKRLFLTGDLGRIRADGALEHLGRMDNQVKIRGSRVEIGEVEAALMRLPEVRDAVVTVEGDETGERVLVGHVAAEAEPLALRRKLAAALPAYMVPSRIVRVDRIPRLPSGKPNRKALAGSAATVPPASLSSDDEARIEALWCEILHLDRADRAVGFFEAGGNSLRAMQLIGRLRSDFGIRVPVRAFFGQPTFAGLAELVAAAGQDRDGPAAFRPRPRRPDMAAALDEIATLPDAEVKLQLAAFGVNG